MGWDLIISEPLWCGDQIWHRMFCRPIAGKTGCNTECEPISKSFNIRKTRWGSLRCIRFLNLPSDKQLQLFSGASLHPSTGAQASADEQATQRVHKKRLGRQWWSDDEEGQKLAMNKKILVVGRANIDSCLVFDRHHSLILPRAKFTQYTVVVFWPDWLALSICTWSFERQTPIEASFVCARASLELREKLKDWKVGASLKTWNPKVPIMVDRHFVAMI